MITADLGAIYTQHQSGRGLVRIAPGTGMGIVDRRCGERFISDLLLVPRHFACYARIWIPLHGIHISSVRVDSHPARADCGNSRMDRIARLSGR